MHLPRSIAAGKRRVKEMALVAEWFPEEWPDGIPSVKQLLDGSASIAFRIPTLKERLYRSFTVWSACRLTLDYTPGCSLLDEG
jgi:hypothetical protein